MERPKRRRSKDNPYTLMEELNNFKVVFIDSKGNINSIKIEPEIFSLLDNFELEDLSYMNELDRHIANFDIDKLLYSNNFNNQKSAEEEAISNIEIENIRRKILKLSEVQKRRILLYFFHEMTLEEIAIIENCTPQAIHKSINNSLHILQGLF